MRSIRIISIYILSGFQILHAQSDSSNAIRSEKIFSLIPGLQYGFIFAHSPTVENTKGANPFGIDLSLAWQKNDSATWNLCNCFPQKGILVSFYDYDTDVLGESLNVSYFLEPFYRLGKNTFFSIKGAAGLSYLTNPFDSVHNPTNMSYSSTISGYLLVGVGLWFRLHKNWKLNTSFNYQHVSNGGLKLPNKGINFPTAGIAVSYQKNPLTYYTGIRSKEKFWRTEPLRWDAGIFGMALRETDIHGESKRRPMIGFNFQVGKQVGRINELTLGTELIIDEALNTRLEKDSIDASHIRLGLLAGHEFLLGKIIFSQRVGYYLFNQTPYYDRFYHRWGIQYRFNEHWSTGINLQAHKQVAEFVDVRLTYSWK